MTQELEFITPESAASYMERNFSRNRNRRKTWVTFLASQMASDCFIPTHQGIAFDEEGNLIDGQHRLQAILLSGKGQWLWVARDVPRAGVLAIDRHAKRREYEQMRVVDAEMGEATHTDVAIARMMNSGLSRNTEDFRLDGIQLLEFVKTHWDAIKFCQRHAKRRRTSCAPIRAAVARAYYYAPTERLEEFMRVLDTGESNGPQDFAAVALRNKMDREEHLSKGGGDVRGRVFSYTCSALTAFLERRPITKIYEIAEDPFPMDVVRNTFSRRGQ